MTEQDPRMLAELDHLEQGQDVAESFDQTWLVDGYLTICGGRWW